MPFNPMSLGSMIQNKTGFGGDAESPQAQQLFALYNQGNEGINALQGQMPQMPQQPQQPRFSGGGGGMEGPVKAQPKTFGEFALKWIQSANPGVDINRLYLQQQSQQQPQQQSQQPVEGQN